VSKPYLLVALLLTSIAGGRAFAQDRPQLKTRPTSPPEGTNSYSNRLTGTVRVTLEKRLEMKKLKLGDPVETKLQEDIKVDGEMVVAKKSRLVGHVAELMSRDRGDPITRLAIRFDRAVMKSGSEMPIYGVLAGVLVPQSNSGDELAALQDTKLRHMRTESLSGTPSPETSQNISELYHTSITGAPTTASAQWNCQQAGGGLWCVPGGHTLSGLPVPVDGLSGVLLQAENTPQGPLGVLVSGKNFNLNGGIDLLVRLVPQP
jgi:hypothetical protein